MSTAAAGAVRAGAARMGSGTAGTGTAGMGTAGTGTAGTGRAARGNADAQSRTRGQARAGERRGCPVVPSALPRPSRVPSALALLSSARHGLAGAAGESSAGARYVAAHLAALRAAAAVVAARSAPGTAPRRGKPRSVWELLPRVEPALGEWAAFFAAGARKRAAAEAGLQRAVTSREADDLLRDAETFLSLAEQAVGVAHPGQAPLPLRTAG
jgi:hypothetical protein